MESTKEFGSEENAKRDDVDEHSDKIVRETSQNEAEQCSKDIYIQKDVGYFTSVDETKLHKSQDYEQSSDTSALMKLAEIACNTTDSQVNTEEESSLEHKTGGTQDIQNLQYLVKEGPIQDESAFPATEGSTNDTTPLPSLAQIPNMINESKSKENFDKVPQSPKGKTSDIEKPEEFEKNLGHTSLALMPCKSVDLGKNPEENDKLNLSNISSLNDKSFSSDSLQKISTDDSLKDKLDKNEKTLELHHIDEFSSLSKVISKKSEHNSDKIASNIGDEIDKVFTQEKNSTQEVFTQEKNSIQESSTNGNTKEKQQTSEKEQPLLSQACCTASSLPQKKHLIDSTTDASLSGRSLQDFSLPETNLINEDASAILAAGKNLNDRSDYFNFISEVSNSTEEDNLFDQSHIRICVATANTSTIEKYKENMAEDSNCDNTHNNLNSLTKSNAEILNEVADKENDIHKRSSLNVETFETSQGAMIAQESFAKNELTKPSNINGNNKIDSHTSEATETSVHINFSNEVKETDSHINLISEARKNDCHIEPIVSETIQTDANINLISETTQTNISLITSKTTETDLNINLATDEVSQRNPIVEAIIQLPSIETSNKTSTENRYQNISTDNSKVGLDSTTEEVEMEGLNKDSSFSSENSKQIKSNINDTDVSFISKDFTVVTKETFSNSKLNTDVPCEMHSPKRCEQDTQESSLGHLPPKLEVLDEINTNLLTANKENESIESSLSMSYIESSNLINEKEKHDNSHSVMNLTEKISDSLNYPPEIQETVSKEICDDHDNITDMSCRELLGSKINLKHSLKIDLKEGEIFSDNEDEESQRKIGQLDASRSQIQSGKIFVRTDLTENIDSGNDEQIPLSSSDFTNISINDKAELNNKSRKRLLSGSSQDSPSKKLAFNKKKSEVVGESDLDEESLVIDENNKLLSTENKSPSKKLALNKKKSEVADESDLDEESIVIDENNKVPSTEKKSKMKQAHKSVHQIYSKEEESMIAIVASTEEICAKCKELWNHNTLKMLFEGNESVTINSRITYGAIICMNIFVGIHYPNFKEEALRGLLERADLAKNLGSIKVSILNSWLLALIKNKKINCCSPFRPIYRIKSRSLHLSGKNGKDSALECKSNEENVQNLEKSQDKNITGSSSGNKESRVEEQSKSIPELFIDGTNEDKIQKHSHNFIYRKTTLHPSPFISSSSDSNEGTSQENSYTFPKISVGGKGNKSSFKNVTTKHNPILHNIVLMEKDSLDPNLHPLYDNLVCESKITEAEARYGKRKYISNKEVLSIHSVCILNSKKINLKNYFALFLQILHHREYSIFIPDHKTLVKHVENLRREDNRHKYSLSKTKQFRQSPWDNESLYSASFSSLKSTDGWPTIREILTIFCLWKNRKLLPISDTEMNLAKEVSALFRNKFEIKDCLGLCIRLYTIYCRLMFDESLSDVGKAKLFLNLHYLPKMEQELQKDKIALNFSASFLLQTQNDLPSIISYLEEQAMNAPKTVRHTLPEIIIDCKLEQTKKLKRELLSNINDPLVTDLFATYATLKNELNFLEEEKTKSSSLVHTGQTVSYSPQMKLMMAKLRVGNVPTEVIPSVMEKVFKNLLKRKVPNGCINSSPY